MTANEIFREVLKDPILIEKYGFTREELDNLAMHQSAKPVIEIIKMVIQGKENNYPDSSVYNQIRKIQKIG